MSDDRIVFAPDDVDLTRSPLRKGIAEPTYVLGAFNPALTRLPGGNLLLLVRVAEALREPVRGGCVRSIRWTRQGYVLDSFAADAADVSDPRFFSLNGGAYPFLGLTSLSWLLPVELNVDGTRVEAIHYDRAIAPRRAYQCYGVEDARISRVDGRYYMTSCSVSPERHSTTLYTSEDALDWHLEGIVLDHQNKDMLIFEGKVADKFWAQTRPLGDLYFAYPPDSPWRAGPSINLATSPDALHWKPHDEPGIRPHAATVATARMGGGAQPVRASIEGQEGWLTLWHGVEPSGVVGIYRTYWSLLDLDDPSRTIATCHTPLLEPAPALTEPLRDAMYLDNVVFTTGIVDGGDHWIVASGEADLACRITHIPKDALRASPAE